MQTAFVLYRSLTDLTPQDQGCRDLLAEARARNSQLGLTGHLHLEDGSFFQWLEGPSDAVADVMQMIRRDPRHRDLEVLSEGVQQERQFGEWTMGFGSSEPGTLFNWISDTGIAVADRAAFSLGILAFLRSDQAA